MPWSQVIRGVQKEASSSCIEGAFHFYKPQWTLVKPRSLFAKECGILVKGTFLHQKIKTETILGKLACKEPAHLIYGALCHPADTRSESQDGQAGMWMPMTPPPILQHWLRALLCSAPVPAQKHPLLWTSEWLSVESIGWGSPRSPALWAGLLPSTALYVYCLEKELTLTSWAHGTVKGGRADTPSTTRSHP